MLNRVELCNFRNHRLRKITSNSPCNIILGKNGSGKTSILESISLLCSGRNLRGATYIEMLFNSTIHFGHSQIENELEINPDTWQVKCSFESQNKNTLPNNIEIEYTKEQINKIITLNGKRIKNMSELKGLCSFIYLTPKNEMIFACNASERRSFFDRMVHGIFPSHASLLSQYNHHIKSRLQILKEPHDVLWLDAVENSLANLAAQITLSRMHFIKLMQYSYNMIFSNNSEADYLKMFFSELPLINLTLKSQILNECGNLSEHYHNSEYINSTIFSILDNVTKLIDKTLISHIQEKYKSARKEDALLKKSTFGSHKEDFTVFLSSNKFDVKYCSIGEQKLCTMVMLLTYANLVRNLDVENEQPSSNIIMLLDDVISRLDQKYQKALLDALYRLGIQIWITAPQLEILSSIKTTTPLLNIITL
ncbi:DNA replication/repair protein RecF [Candidatus Fokinia crypta]|uniref:DNA replication and repair protein RecF n=1 Tax=Candidatus Fokinia crypta TaxID=1920990 RepID=A0ABZ0US87_9RICK|nr:AAA family ATPase [Candidatus Fokinia cryptica]WPX98131.1 DNA replication and repair protein RecF [Candidatus Fokinia cryptica]